MVKIIKNSVLQNLVLKLITLYLVVVKFKINWIHNALILKVEREEHLKLKLVYRAFY